MVNKPRGDGREVLDIPLSFFVHRLVGIGAKSFVALSHQCLKGFVVNVDHTKKCLGEEERNMQERTPCFFPWTTVPASPTLQPAARRVTMCDKTCWAPALLSHWHRARWPRGWADFPAFPGVAWSHQLSSLCCQSSDSFQP